LPYYRQGQDTNAAVTAAVTAAADGGGRATAETRKVARSHFDWNQDSNTEAAKVIIKMDQQAKGVEAMGSSADMSTANARATGPKKEEVEVEKNFAERAAQLITELLAGSFVVIATPGVKAGDTVHATVEMSLQGALWSSSTLVRLGTKSKNTNSQQDKLKN
jgi:hypothetical protein